MKGKTEKRAQDPNKTSGLSVHPFISIKIINSKTQFGRYRLNIYAYEEW